MRYHKRANYKASSIISQERSHAVISAIIRRWAFCTVTAGALLLMAGVAPVQAADLSIKPSLAVSEEYTDNVYETNLHKRSDFITRVQPGFALKYNAPLWDWDLAYIFDYLHYAKNSRRDALSHYINGKGLVRLVDEVLFLELSDSYRRVSLDVTRDTSDESLYLNQSDQNVGTVSPYIVLHPFSRLRLKTGYRYVNTWYKKSSAVSKQDHIGFISAEYEMTPKFFMTADYTFMREIPEKYSSFYRQDAYFGPRYEYADKSFLYAQGGFIYTDYDKGEHYFNPSWRAGLTHSFDTVIVDVSTGTSYSEDPLGVSTMSTSYNASLTKNFHRGSLKMQGSYTEFTDTILDKMKVKRYSGGFTAEHELMHNLRGTLGLLYENYHDLLLNGTTDRYFVNCGLSYDFGNELTAGLNYKYIDYYSKELVWENRQVNRVILEVRKVF